MQLKLLFLIISIISITLNASAKPISCLIKGSIINRNSKAILLIKATDDPRTFLKIRIPIVNNTFEYKLIAPEQEAYKLIFEDEFEVSSFKPVVFFPDTSVVQFTLYAMADAEENNKITGGSLNRSYQQHLTQLAASFKSEYLVARQNRRDAVSKKPILYIYFR